MEVYKYTCSVTEMQVKLNLDEYNRNLRELLFELQRKRMLLEDCREELNESTLKQQDLERQLTNEKRKNKTDEYNRIILHNGAEALEQERQKCLKELKQLKVQLELAVAERDSLREQVRSQCLDISNLKREVDDMTSKHRCHIGYQKDLTEQLSKIKNSLNQVSDLMNPLRKKQEDLDNLSRMNNISEQLLLSAKQIEKQKYMAEKQRDEMERKLIVKSAELSELQQLLENSCVLSKTFNATGVQDYWKKACEYLEYQLRMEKDGTELLTNALKLSNDNEAYLRNELLKQEQRTSDLEKLLKKKNDTETNKKIVEIVDLVKSETID